jgi:hypothetical protein
MLPTMVRIRFRSILLLLALSIGTSCSANKDAVAVSASIANASVAVAKTAAGLVSNLSGGFDVYLELGARASGPTDVTLVTFSLVRAETNQPLLTSGKPLSVVSSGASPIHLNPGDKASVHLDISASGAQGKATPMEITNADLTAICGAGSLKILGQLKDSSMGDATSVASMGISPTGC